MSLVNNTIVEPHRSGILVGIWNKDFKIIGNTIRDPFDPDDASPSTTCIDVRQHTNKTGYIAENTFIYSDDSLNKVATYSLLAVSATSGKHINNPRSLHTGGTSATVMTDATPPQTWTTDEFVGRTIWNVTDDSTGVITANDATTVTVASLSGGSDNQWELNDEYEITNTQLEMSPSSAHTGGTSATVLTDTTQYWPTDHWVGSAINNTTDGSTGTITSNTATTSTCSGGLSGGTDNEWKLNDAYNVDLKSVDLYKDGYVWNTSDFDDAVGANQNSWATVTSNTTTTATIGSLSGGARNYWRNGDSFNINGLDFEIGRNYYSGNDSTHLTTGNLLQPGITINDDHVESGVSFLVVPTGADSANIEVKFKRPFQITPRVFLSLVNDLRPGDHAVTLVANSVNTTRFFLTVGTADITNFTTAEEVGVVWEARTVSEH